MPKNTGGLSWVKKAEPKFIREFKERVAYKDQPTADTKKKKLDNDLLIEREEDRPQVVQLRAGDLGEQEYIEHKSKEEIANAGSSFGKIIFKRPTKKGADAAATATASANPEPSTSGESTVKKSELDLIFNLKDGQEQPEEEAPVEAKAEGEKASKKKFLDDEEEEVKYGLQPAPKKRSTDDQANSSKSTPGNYFEKVRAKEAKESKGGNKKLLSFYDEEFEQDEEAKSDQDD